MGAWFTNCCCRCGCVYCCTCCKQYNEPPPDAKSFQELQVDMKTFKTGDIILERSPNTSNNNLVKIVGAAPWTHVGIVHKDDEGIARFIEVVAKYHFRNNEIGPHFIDLAKKGQTMYIGHRSINRDLTTEEMEKFKKGLDILSKKDYDGTAQQFYAGCDCCSCLPCVGETCCGLCSKSEEERLEELFCSELVAELLQRTGISNKNVPSDEFVPADFHDGR